MRRAAALVDRQQRALADAVGACVHEPADRPLRATLERLAVIVIARQWRQPLVRAALDHDEQRLPEMERVAEARRRIASAVATLLARHGHEVDRPLPGPAARDLLVITKASIEADARVGRPHSEDLRDPIASVLKVKRTSRRVCDRGGGGTCAGGGIALRETAEPARLHPCSGRCCESHRARMSSVPRPRDGPRSCAVAKGVCTEATTVDRERSATRECADDRPAGPPLATMGVPCAIGALR